jgi:hypothetical protein
MKYKDIILDQSQIDHVVKLAHRDMCIVQTDNKNKRFANHLYHLIGRLRSGKTKFTSKQADHIGMYLKDK